VTEGTRAMTRTPDSDGRVPGVADTIPPRLLDPVQAGAYLGTTAQHLRALRASGRGPSYVRVGRKPRYRREDLDAWATTRLVAMCPPRPRRH
jgi:hypothetical protein